jgi:hypothetical protein
MEANLAVKRRKPFRSRKMYVHSARARQAELDHRTNVIARLEADERIKKRGLCLDRTQPQSERHLKLDLTLFAKGLCL